MRPDYWKSIVSLIVITVFSYQAFSQSKRISIDWSSQPKKVLAEGVELEALDFSGAQHDNGIPVFVTSLAGDYSSVQIENAQYEEISTQEAQYLPKSVFTLKSIEVQSYTLYEKGRPQTMVSLNAVRFNDGSGQVEKLTSFTITSANSFKTASKNAKTASFSTSSVLGSGDWYKLSVSSSGLYKLDYNFLKNTMSIDIDNVDPQYIQIYGNHGGMLPQRNSDARPDDLTENAIFVSDGGDGSFDQGDYVLFYGQQQHVWEFSTSDSLYHSVKNYYSDVTYYFLTIGTTPGKRISDQASLPSGDHVISTYDHFAVLEQDATSFLRTGREWYGDIFNFTLNRSYNFGLSDVMENSEMDVIISVMSSATSSSSFSVSFNGVSQSNLSIGAPYPTTGSYGVKGKQVTQTYTVNENTLGSSSSLSIDLTFNKGSSSASIGYLDYIEVHTERALRLSGTSTTFRSIASVNESTTEFQVSSMTSAATIWDITDLNNITKQLYTLGGSTATFIANSDSIREYIVWTGSSFPSPGYVGQVANQDLHGITTSPTLLIVAHPNFLSEAQQLANFKENTLGMSTEVVTTSQVYNEFSSGAQDITAIRDFAKMLYDRSTATDSLRYLLLFGDASYDYKSRLSGNTNYVPVYESRQSLHNIDSYSSDDYFGFLDDSEGYWNEDPSGDYLLDIGVGRLPVADNSQAQTAVDKIIKYTTDISNLGNWQNRVTFVADDGDGVLHMNHAEIHSQDIQTNYPVYNLKKIYLDAYVQLSSPSGEIAPESNEALDLAMARGTLIMNYTGHGGGTGWAQEAVLTTSQINKFTNINKLPLFVTATCEFGRYDNPEKFSGAENLLLNPNGGAIALVTTTRAVFAFSNLDMNAAVYDYVFEPISDSIMPTLGDVIRQAKNEPAALYDINNRNFSLLGDPSLTLAYPDKEVVITKINDSTVTATPDTLKALGTVTISGEVRSRSGVLLNNYSGELYATIFDKSADVTTLGNEGATFNFTTQDNIIYEGLATVSNGQFSFTFVVPKDISYQLDFGKISLYAKTGVDLIDAHGVHQNVIIGGSADSVAADDTPPMVDLFMDDESFVFGGQTGTNTTLIAKLTDDNGINISNAGIGHEITAILDGNEDDIFVMNDFYTTELDDYTAGKVEYPFNELAEGNHSLRVKAWDTHNNSGEDYIEFVVANDAEVALQNVLNYPNPFTTNTEFHFDHNRAGDDLDIQIQIYTISGRLIRTLNSSTFGSPAHISSITWNGTDEFGDKIGKGVYVYKVNVRSMTDGSKNYKIQRLVILN